MKRAIHLHGRLGKELGERFELDVDTAGEAFRALNANFPNRFIGLIKEGSYYIVRGDAETGLALDEEALNDFRLGKAELHIIPVVEGSESRRGKGGGGIKAIAGIALIGIAIFASGGLAGGGLAALGQTAIALGPINVTWGSLALFGAALAINGAASMLSPKEKPKDETKRDDSFAFSGPINTNEQGNPVPLIYGRVITGGQPISSGIDIEDISTFAAALGSGVPGFAQALINGVPQPVQTQTINWNAVS